MAELALSNLKANPERLKKLISKIKDGSPFTKVKGDITKASDNVYLRFVHPFSSYHCSLNWNINNFHWINFSWIFI